MPVMAAEIAISAVSGSRISPTMTTSGSWRRMERKAAAKVSPALALTSTCVMPSMIISTGFSTVTMLMSSRLISRSAVYRVVVLPEPVARRPK